MSINITHGGITLYVNDDPNRVISFDPEDVGFVDNFYCLIRELEAKRKEFEARAVALSKDTETDELGLPKNTGQQIALLKDVCSYMRERIDAIFGVGTSQIAFGGSNSLVMFQQFFEGVTPHIQKARNKRISKYTSKYTSGSSDRVMR